MTQKALWLPVLRSHRAFLLQCSGKQSGQFFQPTDGLVQQLLRRVKIREALGQIDGVILVVDAGHAADDGIRKRAHAVAELRHIFLFLGPSPSQLRCASSPEGRAFLLPAKKDLLFDVIFSMTQSVLEISLLDG